MTEAATRSQRKIAWTLRGHTFLYLWWIARAHPSVLWRFLKDNFHTRAAKRGQQSSSTSQVRAEFDERAAKGQFKELWFDMNIVPWCATFSKVFKRTDPVRMLEIGSWEGRSSLFLLTYFQQGQLTAVDTWAGSDQYEYNATSDLRELEARFDHNTSSGTNRLTKRKGSSLVVLPQLIDEQQKFDLIYVDGSHFADDALTDAINAWRLLNDGGVMILDDVMWPCFPRARANTAWAITSFLKYHTGEYKILHAQYQMILQKKVAFVDQPADWRPTQAKPVPESPTASTGSDSSFTNDASTLAMPPR